MNNSLVTDLFFDLDHTLWDFERNSKLTFQKIFSELKINIPLEHFIKNYKPINLSMWKKYRKNIISQEELRYVRLKKTFESLNKTIEPNIINNISKLYIDYLSSYPHLFPGTINVLNELSDKYNLHIITNGFKNIQYKKLESSGIVKFFKNVFTSEDFGYKKPHPLIFKKALEITDTSPSSAIMIGDSLEVDILGSMQQGMQAIHFNSNKDPLHNHCIIIDNIDEILNFI
ncbi:MAG: noncanonical pyrimidine nucleotidase, YjjG family [Flavobacteriaceae bacterium]|nr:noncanonical pyrimidine nucleotidase, YjjG family [Flavobacteriaceae bacterium]